jgi:hypothetical protein
MLPFASRVVVQVPFMKDYYYPTQLFLHMLLLSMMKPNLCHTGNVSSSAWTHSVGTELLQVLTLAHPMQGPCLQLGNGIVYKQKGQMSIGIN